MADSISIVMKLQDDISGEIKNIASAAKGCSKEFETMQGRVRDLGRRYDDFSKRSAAFSAEALAVKKSMDAAKKTFGETQNAVDKANFESLKRQYEDLTAASKAYSQMAKETVKDMNGVYQEARKLGDSSNGSGEKSGLMKSGLIRDFGSSVSGLLGAGIASSVGQPMATMLGETLSGTISGISAGAIAGLPGMAAGAVIGAISGRLNAETALFQAEDDAFKDYYKGLYETVNANTEEGLTTGSAIAGGREQTMMAFSQKLGGDEAATAYLDRVKEMAASTNYSYDDITGYSKMLLNSYGADETLDVLMKLSDATAGLGLSGSDVETWINGLSRMRTTGKTSQEYLNYFSERDLDVYEAIAEGRTAAGMQTDKSEVADLVSGGKVSGGDAAQYILNFIQRTYGGLSETLAGSYQAMTDNLGDVMADIQAAGGATYNEERKEGLAEDLSAYGGTLGDKLAEVSEASGKVKAYGENLESQFQREALSAVLEGKDTTVFDEETAQKLADMGTQYQGAYEKYKETGSIEAAKEMENLKENAEALATAAFESSEWYQEIHTAELDQIEAIRKNTTGLEGVTKALDLANAFSKGQNNDGMEEVREDLEENTQTPVKVDDYSPFGAYTAGGHRTPTVVDDYSPYGAYDAGSHAYGLGYVPYDGYRAVLHQGERVLTAAENREKTRAGGGVSVTISGPVTVRQESDIDAIAASIVTRLEERALLYGG